LRQITQRQKHLSVQGGFLAGAATGLVLAAVGVHILVAFALGIAVAAAMAAIIYRVYGR
jgi:uncharacterized membrane protein YebE (DUF533 family)